MIIKELLGPIDPTETQDFCIYKLREVIMICENKDLVFIIF